MVTGHRYGMARLNIPLSVTIDCRLTMADHVTAVCRTGYFWLRQLRSVVQSLTSEAADSLVHAFISCRLDYCNALVYCIADGQLRDCNQSRTQLHVW